MDNKKTDIKQMISNVREVFVIVTMFLGLIIFIACSIVTLIKLFTGQFLASLIFALIAAAAFIAAYFVMSRDDKRTAKKKREYRLENITEMKVIDLELGELYFEYDSKIGELSIAHGIPALCGEGEIEITSEETGMNTTPLIECLKRLLKDKDKIVEGMLGVVQESYENEGITEALKEHEGNTEDEAGEDPTDREYILSRLVIDRVWLSSDGDGTWSASISGDMKDCLSIQINEHGISAELSSDSPDYEFYSG